MAVVPMQKVRLLIHQKDVDAALDVVQQAGALELKAVAKTDDAAVPEVIFPHAELLPRVQHAVKFLEPYAPKVGLWRALREGTRAELHEADIAENLSNTDATSAVVEDLERLQVEFADMNERLRLLEERHNFLETWQTLAIKLVDLSTKKTSTFLFEAASVDPDKLFSDIVTEDLEPLSIPYLLTTVSERHLAVTIPNDPEMVTAVKKLTEHDDVELVEPVTGTDTPAAELPAVKEKLVAIKKEVALLHDQAEHFAMTHIRPLRISGEILSWQQTRFVSAQDGVATTYTIQLEGWLNTTRRAVIEAGFAKRELAAVFADLEPEEGEEPPVEIENSPLVRPFEAVTRLYGMPGYRDLDPTVFLAGFFFLFFGLSLTDVGYGIFLMVASAIIITLLKVSDAIKLFAKLLFFVGFATVLVGMAFGGYLGIAPEKLPQVLVQLQQFDPIGNPLPVFYLALSLGVVQVMVGMLLKIYSEHRNGRLVTGLLDQGPWFFVFCVAILALLTQIGYVSLLPLSVVINLIYVGAILVVLSGARKGKGIFGKIMSAAASLYDSIGYFSDILSYSRLLALGLATTALAFAVNLIAGMVVGVPYVGYILAGVILLIGHVFNLVVNTLGAFIHSARLQFVEFFGKFIAGTGKEFAPLSRSADHVTIVDD